MFVNLSIIVTDCMRSRFLPKGLIKNDTDDILLENKGLIANCVYISNDLNKFSKTKNDASEIRREISDTGN